MNGYFWTFHTALAEQADAFLALTASLVPAFAGSLRKAPPATAESGPTLRADFADEETAREFWLELHSQCLDQELALELVGDGQVTRDDWQALDASTSAAEDAVPLAEERATEFEVLPLPEASPGASAAAGAPLERFRPPIAAATLYSLLRDDDPEMEAHLEAATRRIEAAGLPIINLLSYLDLPLFINFAATHDDDKEQTLFLHTLHTWTCFRHFGERCYQLTPELARAFEAPRYLRLNTTAFRTPVPALCVQFPLWTYPLRGTGAGAPVQWVKEVYLTHLEPPTPVDDRELTLMIVTHDERGNFNFVPLEVPLSLPGVGQSITAFFAPGIEEEEFSGNCGDLQRITQLVATYCLYASARDPRHYLDNGGTESPE